MLEINYISVIKITKIIINYNLYYINMYWLVRKPCHALQKSNENNKKTFITAIQSTCTGFNLFTLINAITH